MSEPAPAGTPRARVALGELTDASLSPAAPKPLRARTLVADPGGLVIRVLGRLSSETSINIYQATLEGTGEEICLREAADDASAARLRHEAEVLQSLDSPAFLRSIACFEWKNRTYLVTEPLPAAGRFSELLANGAAPLDRILPVFTEITHALAYLHERGWAHAALGPDSVALGAPVRILDLGSATRLGQKAADTANLPAHSAPELRAGGEADPRVDVYSVGALLYQALAGESLPETSAWWAVWHPKTPLPGVPQVFDRCLGSRQQRYATMAELHQDLARLLGRREALPRYRLAAATAQRGQAPPPSRFAYGYLTGQMECETGAQSWAVVCLASPAGVRAVLDAAATRFATASSLAGAGQEELVREWAHLAGTAGGLQACALVIDRQLAIARGEEGLVYLLRDRLASPVGDSATAIDPLQAGDVVVLVGGEDLPERQIQRHIATAIRAQKDLDVAAGSLLSRSLERTGCDEASVVTLMASEQQLDYDTALQALQRIRIVAPGPPLAALSPNGPLAGRSGAGHEAAGTARTQAAFAAMITRWVPKESAPPAAGLPDIRRSLDFRRLGWRAWVAVGAAVFLLGALILWLMTR
jgi:hypothetical protein